MSGPDDDQNSQGETWGEAVTPSSGMRPRPGDIVLTPGLLGAPEPLVGPDESTPLEEDEPEGVIPPSPLWAMKDHRHIQWHLLPAHERHDRVRDCIGSGDDAIYVIDDGRHHVALGRRVGATADGCEYSLVGRASRERYEELLHHQVSTMAAFRDATELALCGVAVEEDITSSNVFDVARYGSIEEVPSEYLPGEPFITFTQDLEITA